MRVFDEHPLAGRDIQYRAPDSQSRKYSNKLLVTLTAHFQNHYSPVKTPWSFTTEIVDLLHKSVPSTNECAQHPKVVLNTQQKSKNFKW